MRPLFLALALTSAAPAALAQAAPRMEVLLAPGPLAADAEQGHLDVTLKLSGVDAAAAEIRAGGEQVQASAAELSQLAEQLTRLVGQFRVIEKSGDAQGTARFDTASATAAASRTTAKASAACPLRLSATPTTATSAICAWAEIASSISRVPRRWPATLITSSVRPRMK